MGFEFKSYVNPTKDLILSRITEEQIFAFYLGSVVRSKKLFCSKLRSDKNPTCSFYRNRNDTLIYKDFATGQSLSCFDYVMELYHCTYKEALRIIANDFGIVTSDNLPKNSGKIISKDFRINEKEFSKIQVEFKEFTDTELSWWKKYGITKEILDKYNVFSCKHIFLNGNLCASSKTSCPIYGYYGGKYKSNELWRIYFPKRTSYRFLTNWPTKKVQGFAQLPDKGNLLVITKSQKDNMCLYSLGIPACSPNSETQFLSKEMLNNLKERFKYIVVLFDNDLTGISFMNRVKRKYPELIYTWIPRHYEAKDISDFYKTYGRKQTIKLIKNFIQWLKQKNS
jgi:hypothetical protein